MKKLVCFLFVLVMGFSCTEENSVLIESPYKESILGYIEGLKANASTEKVSKLEMLSDELDFKHVSVYKLKTPESVIIVNVKSLDGYKDLNEVKAIFFLNENIIVRSNLVSFKNKENPANYDEVVLSLLNRNKIEYSGKVTFYGLFQNVLRFTEYEKGMLIVSGTVRQKKEVENAGDRKKDCVDWYLVTTYYYGDHTSESWQFYYSDCDCESGGYGRPGRVSGCEGGYNIGSGQAPSPPSSHSADDEFEYVLPDGSYWKFKSDGENWITMSRGIPQVVIIGNPSNYGTLAAVTSPYDGQSLYGENDFLWTYDAANDAWNGDFSTVYDVEETDPGKKLCATATFYYVNTGFTAEVSGLGVSARNLMIPYVLDVELGISCISIPEYYVATAGAATAMFTAAYNAATSELNLEVYMGEIPISDPALRKRLKALVLLGLPPGSTFSSGPCLNIPTSVATFGC